MSLRKQIMLLDLTVIIVIKATYLRPILQKAYELMLEIFKDYVLHFHVK